MDWSDFTVPSLSPSTHLGIWACGLTWRRHTGKHGSTSYETIPPVPLETSGGVLSTIVMMTGVSWNIIGVICVQSPDVKRWYASFNCYAYNCITETPRTIYIGLRDGRIACVATAVGVTAVSLRNVYLFFVSTVSFSVESIVFGPVVGHKHYATFRLYLSVNWLHSFCIIWCLLTFILLGLRIVLFSCTVWQLWLNEYVTLCYPLPILWAVASIMPVRLCMPGTYGPVVGHKYYACWWNIYSCSALTSIGWPGLMEQIILYRL